MLKKLYVNNYRCLINFEIDFNELTLLMGPNGGGKSTIFDLLFKLRRFIVDNARIDEIFPPDDITAWVKIVDKIEQTFEISVQNEQGEYSYKLVISHTNDGKQRVELEQLLYNNQPLFKCKVGEVQLYHDSYVMGPHYSFDWSMSALGPIPSRPGDNTKLTWFKDWISKLFVVSLQPRNMKSETEVESNWLNRDGTNFPSWYRFFSQQYQDRAFQLTEQLRKTMPGFYSFKLDTLGKQKILQVGFTNKSASSSTIWLNFDQLSDGQRVIIILYSLLFGLKDLDYTLLMDEPENYVSLPEIQPWLMELNNVTGENFRQVILISHHPELVDYFGLESGKWIEREPNGPTRLKKLPVEENSNLKLSEQIARGWVGEQ